MQKRKKLIEDGIRKETGVDMLLPFVWDGFKGA